MPEQEKVVKTIEGLKELRSHFRAMAGIASSNQARAGHIESARIIDDAITMLEMQEPVYVEERLVLDKLHIIQEYARVNQVDWMANGVMFAETVINMLRGEINQLRKAQEPRVMCAAEVAACPKGTVLWVEEAQGVVWNLFPLEIEISSTHPDTGTDYLFFITYHNVRKFECSEYNQTWRCWTQRPTDEQRRAEPWK